MYSSYDERYWIKKTVVYYLFGEPINYFCKNSQRSDKNSEHEHDLFPRTDDILFVQDKNNIFYIKYHIHKRDDVSLLLLLQILLLPLNMHIWFTKIFECINKNKNKINDWTQVLRSYVFFRNYSEKVKWKCFNPFFFIYNFLTRWNKSLNIQKKYSQGRKQERIVELWGYIYIPLQRNFPKRHYWYRYNLLHTNFY